MKPRNWRRRWGYRPAREPRSSRATIRRQEDSYLEFLMNDRGKTARQAAALMDTQRHADMPADNEFLDQAEAEIRQYVKRSASAIMAIGKKLADVKERVGHGRYQVFVRERLGFSQSTALNYVRSYEAFKSATVADLESLQIDARSLYELARPTTPEEIRTKALAMATEPDGVTYEEIKWLLAAAKQTPETVEPKPPTSVKIPCGDVRQAARILTANCRPEMLRELIRLLDAQSRPEAAA
jgi:Protein of unknown function (DUF3102)